MGLFGKKKQEAVPAQGGQTSAIQVLGSGCAKCCALEDAVKAAKEFGPRIGHVHLKDIRPDMMEKAYAEGFKFRKAVLEGCFTIPGDGCVDYPGVFKALHDAHYEGWFIVEAEQDPAKANPLEYAKMAREYIKKTAGI